MNIVLQAAGLGVAGIVLNNVIGEGNPKARYWVDIALCVTGVVLFLTWLRDLWDAALPVFKQFGL